MTTQRDMKLLTEFAHDMGNHKAAADWERKLAETNQADLCRQRLSTTEHELAERADDLAAKEWERLTGSKLFILTEVKLEVSYSILATWQADYEDFREDIVASGLTLFKARLIVNELETRQKEANHQFRKFAVADRDFMTPAEREELNTLVRVTHPDLNESVHFSATLYIVANVREVTP